MKIKVGVIFGGRTVEHEVSVISAVQAMCKMDGEKYEIIPIYISKDGEWYTGEVLKEIETFQDMDLMKRYSKNVVLYQKNGAFLLQTKGLFKRIVKDLDIVFPIVHGTTVEDGTLQGYLETIGVPYVGVDVYSAVVGQDKVYMKQIFKSEELPITNYVWFYDNEYQEDRDELLKRIEKNLKYPVLVKPSLLGSSVGIKKAKNTSELIEAIEEAIMYDKKIVVEEMVLNLKEVNISVLGNYENQNLSVIEQVITKNDLLTYEDKYIGNGKTKGAKRGSKGKGMVAADRIIPAKVTEKEEEAIGDIAIRAFKALGTSGCCRIDFLIDEKTNKIYINEINNIPGSLSFYLWEPKGKDYSDLLDDMINIGIKNYKNKSAKIRSFDTNILKGFSEGNGIKGSKGKLR
ncbi:MAG: D-alanine--D-alanine ligase [Bacilli bacterium]|nr:D-alanine--D-alanine ligase [Bacilli bacterium]